MSRTIASIVTTTYMGAVIIKLAINRVTNKELRTNYIDQCLNLLILHTNLYGAAKTVKPESTICQVRSDRGNRGKRTINKDKKSTSKVKLLVASSQLATSIHISQHC